MNKKILMTISVFFLILLHGCVSVSLPKDKRKNITSVKIEPVIVVSNAVYYNGWESGFSIATNLPIYNTQEYSNKLKVQNYIDKNIKLDKIVYTQFRNVLLTKQDFKDKISDESNFKFQLIVTSYGLNVVGITNFNLKPFLIVDARLVDQDNKIMWRRFDYVANLNKKTPDYPLEQFFESPDKFNNSFSVAADELSKILLKEFN